jgi:hypothetical protein
MAVTPGSRKAVQALQGHYRSFRAAFGMLSGLKRMRILAPASGSAPTTRAVAAPERSAS